MNHAKVADQLRRKAEALDNLDKAAKRMAEVWHELKEQGITLTKAKFLVGNDQLVMVSTDSQEANRVQRDERLAQLLVEGEEYRRTPSEWLKRVAVPGQTDQVIEDTGPTDPYSGADDDYHLSAE